MTPEHKGLVLKSNPYNWSSGGQIDVDRNFLREASGGRMSAPVIREFVFHARLNIDGVTATVLAEDGYKIFDRVQIGDRGGLLYDCSGAVGRVIEQMEKGSVQVDGNYGSVLASGSSSTSYDVFLRVFYDVEKAHRGADTALPLNHMFDGGRINVRFATGTSTAIPGGTLNSAVLTVYAVVHDERTRELKSRMVWKEFTITKTEDYYVVGGSLRAAFITSKLTAAGYTALSSLTTFTSKTFFMTDVDAAQLYFEYRGVSRDRASDDEFIASARNALPIIIPSKGQHIGKMPDLQTFHWKMASVPTSSLMVTCHIENRNIPLAAEWMGFDSQEAFLNAYRERGRVSAEGSQGRELFKWDADLSMRLPGYIDGVAGA